MFTGIVEELGEVTEVTELTHAARITVAGPLATGDARHGDSIAVNGVCLTVVEVRDGSFTADVMLETLRRSSLAGVAPGDRVNLERAAALGHRLGGHLVQGHVDGTGRVLGREPAEHWELVRISLPPELARYVVLKGSITVDGVSLTVANLTDTDFTVSLIPTTLRLTTLGVRKVGDLVNLEVDVVAKYVERLTAPHLGTRQPPAAEEENAAVESSTT
ncbi:MAG TPA: riboflavin synthase [Pseudonocardiaceae bacterium]